MGKACCCPPYALVRSLPTPNLGITLRPLGSLKAQKFHHFSREG